jgi:DNA topoisomerase IA
MQAHPPIHPTKFFAGDGNAHKTRLYEFITRHFLA